MRNAIPGLLLVLVIQLLLVAVVYWPRVVNDGATSDAATAIDPADVTRLDIRDDSEGEAQLTRVGDRWRLPALHSLPADPE